MSTFYLSSAQLVAVASLAHAVGKEQNAPILGMIRITASPADVVAVATDRYIAARMTFPLGDTAHTLPVAGLSILVSAADAVMLAKARTGVMLTFDGGEDRPAHIVTAEADNGTRYALTADGGNYPPIDRLYSEHAADDAMPAGIAFLPALLGRLSKFSLPGERPAEVAKQPYWFAASGTQARATVVATRAAEAYRGNGGKLEVLIMPATYKGA